MSRSVNKIENKFLSSGCVFHLYGMTFNGNAPLPFKVHVVEHLPLCYLYRLGMFKQAVGQGRLAMIYMRYDAEISYMIHLSYQIMGQR